MRLAVWSGPRNLSTALMYAFARRADFAVMDEPFYAAWLAATGADHPMRDEIVAAGETDPARVAAAIAAGGGARHLYLKLMAHHAEPGFPMGWAEGCVHVHLIRHPARVVASYAAKREAPVADDLGFRRQAALFDRYGGVVIDAHDIRADPAAALGALCAAVGLDFDPAMLSWPPGGSPADGIWARHWYGAVHASTGFAGPEGPLPRLSDDYARLANEAMPVYERLRTLAISCTSPSTTRPVRANPNLS